MPPIATDLHELAALRTGGRVVARYVSSPDSGAEWDRSLAPRPFLHPVTTCSGVPVTDERPADHRWHLGVSVAIQDVSGVNFWGGRTYVRGQCYTWRDDHGTVSHAGWESWAPHGFAETLRWTGPDGALMLRERRRAAAHAVDIDGGWALDFEFDLDNATGRTLHLGSPAANGRAGAGYGGLFWRFPPCARPTVFTRDREGEATAHGSVAPWLAFSGEDGHARQWTVILMGRDERTREDPWFVRVAGYPGAGSSLAAEQPLALRPTDTVSRRFRALVLDGRTRREDVETWLSQQRGGVATERRDPTRHR